MYNGERFIERAIRSVLAQTHPPNEIIVLDDGSTDNSAELARSFAGVRVIRQENAGIGAARRKLVEEAQGDWIAFCDHDDCWEPNRLETQLPLTADAESVLIYGGVWHVYESGAESVYPLHTAPNASSIDHVIPHPEDIWSSATLLRRRTVLEVGNFNAHYRTGEDMLMWIQLASRGRVVQVPERLVRMSRLEGSTSSPDKRQFQYAVSLYEDEVLPHFDGWFQSVKPEKRAFKRRQLRVKLGYAMAILASYHDADGQHDEALQLYRKARRLAPRSKGVWYRYMRSVLRIPSPVPYH